MSLQAERTYRWLFWCLALTGFVLDQASKYGVFAWLYNDGFGGSQAIVPGAFYLDAQFTTTRDPGDQSLSALRIVGGDVMPKVNKGALWGIGGGNHSEPGTDFNSFFACVSLAAAAALIVWSSLPSAARDRYLIVALGLILAGTFGNFYDRIVFGGVRDFLHWNYWFDFPVFNIADCCLVGGASLLLLEAFFGREQVAEMPIAVEETTSETPAACGLAQGEQ